MQIIISETSDELGKKAAEYAKDKINAAISKRGKARIVLSTGGSQFSFFKYFTQQDIDWEKVEMFHLDEYINLPIDHPASFRKYLKERFIEKVNPGKVHLVNVEGDLEENIAKLSREIQSEPLDLGVIGIGENAHIAFNDPPADFDTKDPFIIVDLDNKCKMQQVGEGWFATIDDVPNQAVTMSVHQIMQCENIISCVPYDVKAEAVQKTIESDITNEIPATILKTHANWKLFLDKDSAANLNE